MRCAQQILVLTWCKYNRCVNSFDSASVFKKECNTTSAKSQWQIIQEEGGHDPKKHLTKFLFYQKTHFRTNWPTPHVVQMQNSIHLQGATCPHTLALDLLVLSLATGCLALCTNRVDQFFCFSNNKHWILRRLQYNERCLAATAKHRSSINI